MDEIINREENLPIFIEELRDMIFDVGNVLTLPSQGVVCIIPSPSHGLLDRDMPAAALY